MMNKLILLWVGDTNKESTQKLVSERVEELFAFESKLKLASTPAESRRNASVWYNKMTLKQFTTLVDNSVDWTEYLNKMVQRIGANMTISSNEEVIVKDIPYYKSISKQLQEMPDYVVKNYLGWIIFSSYSSLTNKQVAQILFEYSRVSSGIQQSPTRSVKCYGAVYNKLSTALSRIYVDKFVPKNTKQKASEMIRYIQESFKQILTQNTWLDAPTKVKALEKLNKFRINVAYPDWLLNDDSLDEYYGLVNEKVVDNKYLESHLKLNLISLKSLYEELRKTVDPETR